MGGLVGPPAEDFRTLRLEVYVTFVRLSGHHSPFGLRPVFSPSYCHSATSDANVLFCVGKPVFTELVFRPGYIWDFRPELRNIVCSFFASKFSGTPMDTM